MKQPKLVDATRGELDAILALAKAASFPQPQYELLEGVLGTFVYVMQSLQNAKTSLKRFRQMLFGKRMHTESRRNVLDQIGGDAHAVNQRDLTDAGASAPGDQTPQATACDSNKMKKCKGHGRNGANAYRGANVVELDIPDVQPGDPCPACRDGKLYDSAPKTIVKVTGQPPLGATVYKLRQKRCRLCDLTVTAPMPKGMNYRKYEPSTASMLACLRYGSGMPFHRLERLQACLHIPLPDATQWDIVEQAAEGPRHAFEEMIRQAGQAEVLHNDDTPARILALMGERRAKAEAAGDAMPGTKAINTSGIVALLGEPKVKVMLFLTGPAHAGTNLAQVLAHRAKTLGPPIQMCDALSANVKGEFDSFLSLCLTHSRRKFVDVAESFPAPCRFVIDVFASVYHHDAHTKHEAMSDQQRLLHHQAHSAPLMQELKAWMEKQIEQREVEPNSGLGQAMGYMLKHWAGLTLFLRKEGAPLDNNICERALKKAIIHRKNSLFYRSQNGADVGDIFMSLIYTCASCDANAFEYLQALQEHVDEVEDNPHLWLPWNYAGTLAKVA